MNTAKKPSKNKARKTRRAEFHRIMNALANDPKCDEALGQLQELTSSLFKQIDGNLRVMDKQGEKAFIKDHIRSLDSNGWVTVFMPDKGAVQIKADMFDYIGDRRRRAASAKNKELAKQAAQCADAVQSLVERAISSIKPRVKANA